jgi:hypothetical protein
MRTAQAQAVAFTGWYVIAEITKPHHGHQLWMAGCFSPADAALAVRAHAGVLPNADIRALQSISQNVLQAVLLQPNEVRRYAP